MMHTAQPLNPPATELEPLGTISILGDQTKRVAAKYTVLVCSSSANDLLGLDDRALWDPLPTSR